MRNLDGIPTTTLPHAGGEHVTVGKKRRIRDRGTLRRSAASGTVSHSPFGSSRASGSSAQVAVVS